ncbi:unnamed protein product [Rotaria magnacalcarata]|uniref:C2H2-type domain-containing protein n=1 Tax=Rotaria magnacalcarata TaxID=392030 RepID=A0A815CP53_9BILA|nr:unnamed protein product [Rotaria magnacalcarata]
METSSFNQSENLSKHQQIKPIFDSASYILGKHKTVALKTNSNQLNTSSEQHKPRIINDFKLPWSPLLTSNSQRLAPVLQKSTIVHNRPVAPEQQILDSDSSHSMSTQNKYKCDQCGIVFASNEALHKHKARFCIGVKDSGIGREPIYSDDEDIGDASANYAVNGFTKKGPAKKVIQHQSPRKKKQQEVNEWKLQRPIRETNDDVEDQISIYTQKFMNNIKTHDEIYNEILADYEQLQRKQKDVIRQMYDLQVESDFLKDRNITLKPTNNRNGQFEELHRRNNRLEEERRLIQEKLEELISNNYQPTKMSGYDPYRLLRDMKEQQELNEKALDFLRDRLIYASGIHDAASAPYVNNRLRRAVVENVRNTRNEYLKSGGHDAAVIARYSDLEYKLNLYKEHASDIDYPEPLKPAKYQYEPRIDPLTEGLKSVNEESERLQNELKEMHRKFDTLSSRTKQLELSLATSRAVDPIDPYDPYTSSTKYSSYQSAVRDTNNDQYNQPNYNQQTPLSTSDKHITSRASPALSLLASNMNPLRNSLGPQLYDPSMGFVIFFDFILYLPSKIETCALIASIHHPKSGLGVPSPLPPLTCEEYLDNKTSERFRVAIVATKQPIPSCSPQQALTIVIEVQTSMSKNASVDELETNAWTKFALFDTKNRLSSGRWKVPLKRLPISYHEHLGVIKNLATYERAELYYRLVNAQDADEQTGAPISPKFREYYAYPLQVS